MPRIANNAKDARRRATALVVALAMFVSSFTSGCQTCRIPRIDPTGASIFSGTTTLDPQLGQLPTPQPAYIAPPVPPSCQPGQPCFSTKKHINLHTDQLCAGIQREFTPVGDEGQLILTPARLIAPVGTEVVLSAGLCGPEKTFIARQPIEWVMSQESVGHFVAVGEDGECSLTRLYRSQPKKTTGSYAVGVSSASEQTVTRGNANPGDDVRIGRGQTWLSLTSPSEGTSYVTVLAPNAKNWDQRRQTAIVHWVDATWQFPSPAIVPAGRPHRLTTTVRRAGGLTPATGWIVRYEVSGGEPAGFAPGSQPAVEVPVDVNGQATVEISQLANQAGATSVTIQVIRPGIAGDAGRMMVGQGFTSVTWSAPGLAVRVTGPQVVQANLESTFRIEVTNPGDIASRDVVVSTTLPPSLEFIGSNPPPQITGNQLDWRLGELPAKTTRVIELRTLAKFGGDVRLTARAQSADGMQSSDTLATSVSTPSLTVAMTGPETADVGEQVQYRVEVANTGNQVLTNVRVTDRFDQGLEQVEGQKSPITRELGDLQPRERKVFGITFVVRAPGKWCHTLDAYADGQELQTAQACVEAAVRSAPAISVKKSGPAQQVEGGLADYVIEVTNTGNIPLTNVRIMDSYSPSLQPKNASQGFAVAEGAITWTIPELGPNQLVRRQVSSLCLRADPAAINRVTVTTDQQATGTDQVTTRIDAAGPPRGAAVPPAQPGAGGEPGNVNADGNLQIVITEEADPVKQGTNFLYFITLTNNRAVSDREVSLRITLSEGLQFQNWTAGVPVASASPDKRTITIKPITELRPHETLRSFNLLVSATGAGKQSVRVDAVSQRVPGGVTQVLETTVFP